MKFFSNHNSSVCPTVYFLCFVHLLLSTEAHKPEHLLQLHTCIHASVIHWFLPLTFSSWGHILGGQGAQGCSPWWMTRCQGWGESLQITSKDITSKTQSVSVQTAIRAKKSSAEDCEQEFTWRLVPYIHSWLHPFLVNVEECRARRDFPGHCVFTLPAAVCAIFKIVWFCILTPSRNCSRAPLLWWLEISN